MPDTPQTTCDVMQEARLKAIPQCPNKNDQDEATYRSQLIDYYVQIRKLQYGYTVKNEGMKLFNSIAGNNLSANNVMWQRNPPFEVFDTAVFRVPNVQERSGSQYNPKSGPSCAITACALNDQVCHKMGFSPLIDGGSGNTNSGASLCSSPNAKAIVEQMCQSQDPEIASKGKYIKELNAHSWSKPGTVKMRKSINQLIKEGILQPGDAFAKESSRATSGSHAITLVDVVRNENNEIVGYTLQANNTSQYKYYSINDKYGESRVTNILPANYHAMQQIDQEAADLQNMSTQEIENACFKNSIKLQQNIYSLHDTEEKNQNLTIPANAQNIDKSIYTKSQGYSAELSYIQNQAVEPNANYTTHDNLKAVFQAMIQSSTTDPEDSPSEQPTEDQTTQDFINSYNNHSQQDESTQPTQPVIRRLPRKITRER